jgi:lipopolysaccharide transport system ATP-binding protein
MGRAEIKKKFDEIVDFAEVAKFLDTPVKRYSSGMYVRLAFAVAAHLEPEILVVDEVLAVGDVQFQKKCLGKMKKVGEDGRTVLFVSHNMEAISTLCTTGIFLESGRMVTSGTVAEVIDSYLHNPENDANQKLEWTVLDKQYPLNDIVKIHGYCIVDEDDKVVDSNLLNSKQYRIKIRLEIIQKNPDIRIAFAIYCSDVMLILTSSAHDGGQIHFDKCQRGYLTFSAPLPMDLLSSGQYFIELLSLVERCGWILPTGNESRIKFNLFRDVELNPYAQYRLGGVSSPLTPLLSWTAENH